ncbi:hypothetical protein BCR42DRAFT_426104 [Absidia repens]|uniref:DUF7721 domain-containing protein n=1 Tax=Absidia repens TaxID=90262 RepID=A0A1X2I301_9FUNG|nr:hypothetical protein BCR42DRAFT_426104 [Absidia repens]
MNYGESNHQTLDVNEAAYCAIQHSKEEEDIFSNELQAAVDDDNSRLPVSEEEVGKARDSHALIFDHYDLSQSSAQDVGSAAALQAHNMTRKTDSSGTQVIPSITELVGVAMGETRILMDSTTVSQSKAIRAAAVMAMRLFLTYYGDSQSDDGGGIDGSMGYDSNPTYGTMTVADGVDPNTVPEYV